MTRTSSQIDVAQTQRLASPLAGRTRPAETGVDRPPIDLKLPRGYGGGTTTATSSTLAPRIPGGEAVGPAQHSAVPRLLLIEWSGERGRPDRAKRSRRLSEAFAVVAAG